MSIVMGSLLKPLGLGGIIKQILLVLAKYKRILRKIINVDHIFSVSFP